MNQEERIILLAQKKAKLKGLTHKLHACMNPQGVLRYSDLITKLRKEIKELEA